MFRQSPLLATERGRDLFVPPDGFSAVRLYSERGYNTLVIADRGFGKTSILHQLELVLEERETGPVAAFVDLSTAEDVDSALELLLLAGQGATGSQMGLEPTLQMPFTRRVPSVQRYLRELARLPDCCFLCDNAAPATVAHPLFGTLRDRLWETEHQFVLAANSTDRGAVLRPPADAFWEQVVEVGITRDRATELLHRRAKGARDWVLPLVDAVGTNPRELLRAAQRIEAGEERPPELTAAYGRRRATIDGLSRAASMTLSELHALGPVGASDARLLQRLGYSRPTVSRALHELENAGLVRGDFRADGPGRPQKVYDLTSLAAPP